MRPLLKRLAARLPPAWQQRLKRAHIALQLRRGRLVPREPEYDLLAGIVSPGDWVIDVGANVGPYTARLSALVGERGRVIAFEPVPTTVALLMGTVLRLQHANVTVINAAASDYSRLEGFTIPRSNTGLLNFYQAHLSPGEGQFQILCLAIDALDLPHRVSLVKIDAEGHELPILLGMRRLLARDKPTLIVEGKQWQITNILEREGYRGEQLPDRPIVCIASHAELHVFEAQLSEQALASMEICSCTRPKPGREIVQNFVPESKCEPLDPVRYHGGQYLRSGNVIESNVQIDTSPSPELATLLLHTPQLF